MSHANEIDQTNRKLNEAKQQKENIHVDTVIESDGHRENERKNREDEKCENKYALFYKYRKMEMRDSFYASSWLFINK